MSERFLKRSSMVCTGIKILLSELLIPSSSDADAVKSIDLYSGMYATVLHAKGTEKMIRVPQSSLVKRGQLTGLYTVGANNNSVLRWIRTGKTYNDSIEVLSGLSDGEKYILSGNGKLYDGVIVENK